MQPDEKPNYYTEKLEEEEQKALTASYIIYKEEDTDIIYAKNGDTGRIDYSGTDFSTVVQNTINNLTSGRTWIEKILLKGNFEMTKTIEVPSYTEIELQGKIKLGDNQASNLEFPKHAGQYGMFYMGDETNGASNIIFHGGEIDGNKANNSGISFYGMTFRKVTNGIAYDVKMHDTGESGIVFEYASSRGWIINCDVYDTGYDGIGCGGFGTINHEIYMVNNFIHGTIPHSAIVVEVNNYNINIIGNIIDYSGDTAGVNLVGPYRVNIVGNIIKNDTRYGIRCLSDDSAKPTHTIIIANNLIYNCAQHGIHLRNYINNVQIHNNIVKNTQGAYSGIVLQGPVTYCNIKYNKCFDDQTTKTQDYGIALLSTAAGNPDYNMMKYNDLRNNQLGGFYTAVAISNNIVGYNEGYITENKGTATIASGGTSITVNHGLAGTPTEIILTGSHSEVKDAYYTNKTSTTFDIVVDAAVTADREVSWRAYYKP